MPIPVSYTVSDGLLTLVVVVLGSAILLVMICGLIVLISLGSRVEAMERQEDQTTAAVDRLANMISAPDQAWFWTSDWLMGEHRVDEDIAAGRMVGPMDQGEFEAYLERLDAEAVAEERDAGRVAV